MPLLLASVSQILTQLHVLPPRHLLSSHQIYALTLSLLTLPFLSFYLASTTPIHVMTNHSFVYKEGPLEIFEISVLAIFKIEAFNLFVFVFLHLASLSLLLICVM